MSIKTPLTLSNLRTPISLTNMKSPVTISNVKGPGVISGSAVTVTKAVTISPRFAANYSINPKEKLNIISVHQPTETARVFTA